MPDDVAAYLLLALDLLVVAVVLTLPVLAVWWLIGHRRRPPRPELGLRSGRLDADAPAQPERGGGRR